MSKKETNPRWEHWSKFVVKTPSMTKTERRRQQNLCIGCGKDPCECKKPRTKRKSR